MFRTIVSKIERDLDYPERNFTLDVHARVLEGSLYDHLPYGFQVEKNSAGEYVPLRDRRPSVRYNLCRLVVDDSVSLLFSDSHFPIADVAGDLEARNALLSIVKGCKINDLMLEAATIGSGGSVAIQMRVLTQNDGSNRLFFVNHPTGFLTPTFDPRNPEKLLKVTERYKVIGRALVAAGYAIPDDRLNTTFWFQREWDEAAEMWFQPQTDSDAKADKKMVVDTDRTVFHTLGFCPWVWVRNMPGKLKLISTDKDAKLRWSDIDGVCTFSAAIDAMIEIEYQLSQAGRGLKYSMDPLLLLKEPAAPIEEGGEIAKQPGTALVVGEDGDAKLLELTGSAFTVVLDYVRALRELGLEGVHGNRADSQKLSVTQSGRAMELMNQALVWLADRLRVSYGEGALLSLLRMALAAHAEYPLTVEDEELPKINAKAKVVLKWPRWYPPTTSDHQNTSTTLKMLKDSRLISSETAVKYISEDYGISDVNAELALIQADVDKLMEETAAASLKVNDNI